MRITNYATLVELLRSRAFYQPNQHAYTFLIDGETEGTRWTYSKLDREARLIGALLQEHHAEGERVLLLYSHGLEFIAAFFGCLYAGAVAVPAYPPRNRRYLPRIQMIVEDAQARILLTQEKTLSKIQQWLQQTSSLHEVTMLTTDHLPEALESRWQEPAITKNTLTFLQYTSGSTSTPKGVMVSHDNLLHNSAMIYQYFEHSPESRVVSWLPFYHDMGLIGGILQPFFAGFPAILMSPSAFLQRPVRWLEAISRYRGTSSGGPNFAFDLCTQKITPEQRKNLDLSSWNVAFSGAEPVHYETIERFTETFRSCGFRPEAFYPCYGLAEATLFVSGGKKKHPPVVQSFEEAALAESRVVEASDEATPCRKLVGSGRIIPEHALEIVHPDTLTRCSPGQIGEIWIAGPSVAQGYWNRPEITRENFQAYIRDTGQGPFLRTGDLGFSHADELFIASRLKDLIIIRGRNHYPQDIERSVEQSHPAIRQNCSAAFSMDVAGEERLVIVAEAERRYTRPTKAPDQQYHGPDRRHEEEAELETYKQTGFSQTLQEPPDLKETIDAIRRAATEYHELNVYAVLLIKATTIPRTSSGKIQRHLCKAGFLNSTLDVLEKWIETPLQNESEEIPAMQLASRTQPPTPEQPATPIAPPKPTMEAIQYWLIAKLSERLGLRPHEIDSREPFARYGVDSLQAVTLSAELEDWLGCKLSPTLLYNYPTIALLSRHLSMTPELAELALRIPFAPKTDVEPIAIIGLSCRFPGANNPEEFWNLLHHGVDAITEVPPERWDVAAFYAPSPGTPGKMNTRWGGFVEQIDRFDADFFGIAPREADFMDPQQRLLLEVAWEALETTGQSPDFLAGSYTGVFIGISNHDYLRLQGMNAISAHTTTGNAQSIAANRLSYFLNLRGPSMIIDTACSSSLVAVHQACLSLRQKECDLALAGGVNLILTPDATIALSQARLMASDGRCKTFDARADGYVRGEGCGIVVLKRLSDALRDGDNLLALIRGSAVNQDGRSNGLTAPNGFAQQAVIYQALENSGIIPSHISYFEANGTGTPLGDPIEVNALKEVLIAGRSAEHPCWIGSVKTNIGHLEAASGIAALIKVVLSLQHEEIPPHLHLQRLNPDISLQELPFLIPTSPQKWLVGHDRRIAGVNSFGFGGTNAHIIIEETLPKAQSDVAIERSQHLLTLSARTPEALNELVERYEAYLHGHPHLSLSDVCFTTNTGRMGFAHRLAAIARTSEDLCEQFAALRSGQVTSSVLQGIVYSEHVPKIVFAFPGSESQYVNMGRELYDTQPAFRRTIDYCNEILRSLIASHDQLCFPSSLCEVLYPRDAAPQPTPDNAQISPTIAAPYAQLALFSFEYALAKLWMSWGIIPAIVTGHEIGEYAAACIAGVFSLDDGLKMILEKTQLTQTDRLQDFEAVLTNMTLSEPQIPVFSHRKRRIITAEMATSHYWRHALQSPKLSPELIAALFNQGYTVFLEIGPQPTFLEDVDASTTFTDQQPSTPNAPLASLLSLVSLRPEQSDWRQLLQCLGALYVHGVSVNWTEFDHDYPRHRVMLPTYPFQRKRYWIPSGETKNIGIPAEQQRPATPDILRQIEEAPEHERHPILMGYLRFHIAEVLGLRTPEQITPRQRLFDLGLDSLMAIELKERFETMFTCSLRSTLLFDYPTLEALSNYFSKYLLGVQFSQEPASELPEDSEPEMTAMSRNAEDDIEALLDQKLAEIDRLKS